MRLNRVACLLVVFALAIGVAIPTGWMPTIERGFALTVCTGGETSTVWMDAKGKIHQSDPTTDEGHDDVQHDPCAFAGSALALNAPDAIALATPKVLPKNNAVSLLSPVTIGQGLAAPPPPATGPPILV